LLFCDSGPTKTVRDRAQSATERELPLLHLLTPLIHTEQRCRIVVIPFPVQPIHRDASLLQHVVLRFASSIAVATSTANVANVHVTTCQSKRCTGVPAEDERAPVALSETLTFVPVAPCKFCPNLPYFPSPGNTTAVTVPAAALRALTKGKDLRFCFWVLLRHTFRRAGWCYWRTSSTRRLRARPSSVSLLSTGRDAPNPSLASRSGAMLYCATSASFTANARRLERSRL
jgi:hypothetical protein